MANDALGLQKQYANPQLKDLLENLKKDILLTLNCHAIATIQSFNSTNQTATATINYPKTIYQFNQNSNNFVPRDIAYPTLAGCPVVILGGGASNLTFPITKGDQCLVLFNDRDMDNWFAGNNTGRVPTGRMHSFSDALIIVGLHSTINKIASYDTARAKLFNGSTSVGVSSSKVQIKNASQNLNTLFQNLCTQLQSLTTALSTLTVSGVQSGGSSSGPPTNAAAITNIGSQISSIATNIGNLLE
jgi:hypothetical protein